jgi:hypothetical protein
VEEEDVVTGKPSRRIPLPESTIAMEIGDDVGTGKKVADVVVEVSLAHFARYYLSF